MKALPSNCEGVLAPVPDLSFGRETYVQPLRMLAERGEVDLEDVQLLLPEGDRVSVDVGVRKAFFPPPRLKVGKYGSNAQVASVLASMAALTT